MKKNVLILFHSSALGDNIAWVPYVEEYRIVNNCNVICAGYFNYLFEKSYPNIKFISPKDIDYSGIDLVIPLGYYIYPHIPVPDIHKDLNIHQNYSLQEYACLLLRLNYKEIKPKIHLKNKSFINPSGKPYVAIATHSTAQCKFWNYPNGWEEIINYLNSLGYDVYSVDRQNTCGTISYLNQIPKNVVNKGVFASLEDMANVVYNADFFIGLASGMSWLAWGLNKKVIMISGFSDPKIEFSNPYRIINRSVCNSCFNNKEYLFDQSDWIWCPKHKNTSRMFECSKSITPTLVKEYVDKAIEEILLEKTEKQILIMNDYCRILKSNNIFYKMVEINPGNGEYSKIFSEYFSCVSLVSPQSAQKQLIQVLKNSKNISFFKKNELKDFSNIEFVYINIDRQTDLKIFGAEISFWKDKGLRGIGGHGWSREYVKNAVLQYFLPKDILIFNNDSWYVALLPRA